MPAFKVEAADADKRLDLFLTAHLKITRSQIQKLIKHGLVTVNGETPSVHQWLKEGDRIVSQNAPKAKKEEPLVPLRIVEETDDYIVVNKPAGVIVHPAPGSTAPSLTAALVKAYPKIKKVGDSARPGIVHRLDRDVSGLMVVARTSEMYAHLVDEFKARRVSKTYTALVEGSMVLDHGIIDFVIARSRTHQGLMAARPKGQEGRPAETRYTVLKRWPHLTLLELELITGRTHQIRAHLKAFRHPLVGDKLYGSKQTKETGLTRPFLQATKLGFTDRQGEHHEFTVPLDAELVEFLNTLAPSSHA